MKVWIGHLVSPIRPNLQPHPSLSGQQTLQHSTGCTSTQHYNVPRRRCCIIEGDSIATFGQVRRSQTFATLSSAKWQINNAPDPWSQLWPKVFLSFIHQAPFPSLPPHIAVLPLLTKVAVFGPRVIQIRHIFF